MTAKWEGVFHLVDKVMIMSPAWFDRHNVTPDKDAIVRHFSIYDCMLYYVDNKKMQFSMEHCAPKEYFVPPELLSNEFNPYIGQSAECIAKTIVRPN